MKLERDEIFFINALDSSTGVIAKDCIIGKKIVTFLVKDADMGKAIGADGKKIKALSRKLGRKIELLAFFEDPGKFFRKAMPKTEFSEIKREGNSLILRMNSTERRKIMHEATRFKRIKRIAERNYSIESVKLK